LASRAVERAPDGVPRLLPLPWANAVVVAGSAFLPEVEEEAARGTHVVDARVHNVACAFGPGGTSLGRSRKVFLAPGGESRAGLRRGRVADLPVLDTPVGRVAVAVCLDGWFDGVLALAAGSATEEVVTAVVALG
jgi:predicted amidohydrolase